MSVCLMISNPVNEKEDNFYVPISTEKVFQDFWMPIIEELELKWSRCFQCGIEIKKEDLEDVLKELIKIEERINNSMDSERGIQMLERLKNLKQRLEDIFYTSRDDIKAYIG